MDKIEDGKENCFVDTNWDSMVVGSALFSNAEILYSEDMQDGLVIKNKLRVVNPFKR